MSTRFTARPNARVAPERPTCCTQNEPLLPAADQGDCLSRGKPRIWWGYLPVLSECLPFHQDSGRIDWPGVLVNVGAGLIMGIRESLGAIVSASLVFSSGDRAEVIAMLPMGISMMLYTQALSAFWYVCFGRLQYCYATQQDLICILQAQMVNEVAKVLKQDPTKIPATIMATVALSSILSGICCFTLGKLGLGNYMLLFPTPVINGFLGAIGVVVCRAAMQTSSGVKFIYFYPEDWEQFCEPNRVAQMLCMLAMICCIRLGPDFLKRCFPGNAQVARLGGLACQLMPLGLFYVVARNCGYWMSDLQEMGWTYPKQGSSSPLALWNTYSASDVDISGVMATMPQMPSLILMSAMCTMMGVLAITDAFPRGPEGDPAPLDNVDFDTELCVVGASSVVIGCTGGNLNFHKFSAIQLRLDGGEYRVAVLMIVLFSGGLFLSGVPIGMLVPKWFLAGLFMNTGIHFLKGTLLSYRSMSSFKWRGWNLPSPQYTIAPATVLMAVFFTPATAILLGLVLSIGIFLVNSSASNPVSNVVVGDRVMSRSKRPFWEMRTLRQQGDRIVLLYLQGQLFFGSARKLVAALAAAAASDRVRFCILSFAKVTGVDASAARHLKTSADRLRQRGCHLIYCRMNHAVYSALTAAKVVVAPDPDLVSHLQNLRWKTVPMFPSTVKKTLSLRRDSKMSPSEPGSPLLGAPSARHKFVAPFSSPRFKKAPDPSSPEDFSLDSTQVVANPNVYAAGAVSPVSQTQETPDTPDRGNLTTLGMQTKVTTGCSVGSGKAVLFDAFPHETDALDYCDERLVTEFCYTDGSAELENCMLAYRAAVNPPFSRLPEWAFEDMNNLPRQTMTELRSYCTVYEKMDAWTKLSDIVGVQESLCFILRGSVSVIQMLPISDDVSLINPEVHGFSFREGKRLLKRFPPGHVAGKNGFFLKHSDQVIDRDHVAKIIVSSKMGPPAEIWVLHAAQWETLPDRLRGPLTYMLCVQFADDEQHSQYQER